MKRTWIRLRPFLPLTQKTLAIATKTAIIIFVTVTVFFQDLVIVFSDAFQNETTSYILVVPFVLTYLVYRRRKMIRASIQFESSSSHRKVLPYKEIVGTLLFLMALLIYYHGSFTFTPLEFHLFALPILVTGCTLIMFNTETLRQLSFPILFLFFLTPPPLEIVYNIGATLSTFSSQAAYYVLKTLGLPVSLATLYESPSIILQKAGGPPLTFTIDVACSGIYSLIGFTIFATFIAYIARTSLWKKATLFFIGFPLIYALNSLRIIIIVLIGNYSGMELAMQTFHLLGGLFLVFVGTLLLLIISEKLFKIQLFTTKPEPTSCNYCNQNPQKKQHFCPACGKLVNPINIKLSKRDLNKIALLIIIAILIINFQVPVFALAQGPAEVTIQTLGGEQTVTQILPESPGYTTEFIHRDKKFEELAKQDASLVYAYGSTDPSKTTIWVTIEISKTRSSLHTWEGCLIKYPQIYGQQPLATQLILKNIQLLQDPSLTARFFAFQVIKTNLTQAILYWYESAFFNTGSNIEQKYVKISLIVYLNNPEDVPSVEDQVVSLGKAIANYWQPIKTWAKITLTISQNGPTLIATTSTVLAIVLAYQAVKNLEEKRSNLKVYSKLALEEERLLIQAVHNATQKLESTGNAIALCYRKLTRKPIEPELLFETLKEAEEAGLIKRKITNREDEPILTWKTQISIPKSFIIDGSKETSAPPE